MHTRPVRAEELDLFVETAGTADHRREVEQYMEWMFAAGSMRPEWCFIAEAEQGERPLGRVALWTLPGMGEPFALVLFDLHCAATSAAYTLGLHGAVPPGPR